MYRHFKEVEVSPTLYATSWFMALFTNNVPLYTTHRIWDIFFVEGFWVIHTFALAILKMNEKKILEGD
jgi:cytochrome bd-type quinol oxidase subunit 1